MRPKLGWVGEAIRRDDVGLLTAALLGLLAPTVRLFSCFAVIPTYLEARDPGVIIDSMPDALPGVAALRLVIVVVLVRVAGGPPPGVRRPDETEGVILPLGGPGVARPFDNDSEGVLWPFALTVADKEGVARPETDGVARPLRDEATEGGREIDPPPTVGEESFDAAMKTPQFGEQVKYRFLFGGVR